VPTPDAVPNSLTGEQQLESVWPTWKVFAYWDTGKREKIDDIEVKKLQPMYPFGLYLDHEGTHYGFTNALDGLDGVVVDRLNSFQYRLTVESEGTAALGVKLSAEERPVEPGGGGGNGAGGGGGIPPVDPWVCSVETPRASSTLQSTSALFGLLGLAWAARRRRRSRG
jgi:MYXO-CTERM domain-containing protein